MDLKGLLFVIIRHSYLRNIYHTVEKNSALNMYTEDCSKYIPGLYVAVNITCTHASVYLHPQTGPQL